MPLFPPPQTANGKRYRNKGLQRTTYLTINGRISVRRRWWYDPDAGSVAPIDDRLTPAGENVTVGVRELACRLNNDACSFRRASENLARAAQIKMSAEQLRQVVERDGQRVLRAQERELIAPAMTAADCKVPGERKRTRMYVGVDGVMVPMVTDQEKQKRRKKVVQKRRRVERKGRALRPLLPRAGVPRFHGEANLLRAIDLPRMPPIDCCPAGSPRRRPVPQSGDSSAAPTA